MQEAAAMACILLTSAVMVHAAVCDIRTRQVPDAHWLAIGPFCILCAMLVQVSEGDAAGAVCQAAGAMILIVYMLSERLSGWTAAPALVIAAILVAVPAVLDPGSLPMLSAMVMYGAFLGMYRVGLLRGGADAKCLMTLALAFPVYPEAGPLPLVWSMEASESLVLNPSFSVLAVALVLSLASCVPVLVRNISAGNVNRRMFASYQMPIGEARSAFVWPSEKVVDGEKVPCGPRIDRDVAFDELEAAGAEEVTVTPMVPFLVPLAVSFLMVAFLGTPLALFSARC